MDMKTNPNHGMLVQQLGWIRDKLVEIEQKLDHIIYRMAEEDPRSPQYDRWPNGINGWNSEEREENGNEDRDD